MPVILTTPPPIEPLSLAQAKEHLKVESNADDNLINRLIATARQQVEKQIDKVLIDQTWSIYLDDWPGNSEIRLPVGPVTQVNELRTYSDDDIASPIDPAHFFTDLVSAPQRLVLRGSRIWQKPGRVAGGIEIEVIAGYGPDGASVPAPLRTAMLVLIAHWHENRQPDCSGSPVGSIASTLQNLLGPYKRVRL